ncbi:MAG: stringent starvation protein A [Legionellales bacterium]|nr:stringent starvation protein A [Legionellales bacterium]|tara:strand:+ start:4866 stop:5492 length:627 start_codon:yes stop_codon:yes gene_type:complete
MAVVANKRSVMTLFSDPMDVYCHQVRIVLAEKGVNVEVFDVLPEDKPEDLIDLNPYNSVPTLVDRDLVIYQASIIMEYLDERFPHPPLMPVYPVARAEHRRTMYRVENDLYGLVNTIQNGTDKKADIARKQLEDSLITLAPVFDHNPYFLSEEFTLVDCCLAPLLWRLPEFDIDIPAKVKGLHAYMERVFERDSFQASLSESEREIRE